MVEEVIEHVGISILKRSASFFQYDFEQCRHKFLQQYQAYLGEKSHRFFPLEYDKLLLGTDLIWLGPQDAENIFLFISGTHGVEGYCGSAIQQFLLANLSADTLPSKSAIIMIHGLNPWGMYWARRCDEAGVDLNRNFIDYQNVVPINPDYEDVLNSLVHSVNPFQEMQKQIEKRGQKEFDCIFSGGQYQYSWAPFFGGTQPSHGRKVVESIISEYQLSGRNMMVIDLHTGLGPWGYGELISDHPVNSKGNQYAQTTFGAAIANAHDGTSFSVPKLGLLDYCFHEFMTTKGFFLTLEFGTYGSASLFNVLLRDHVFWKNIEPSMLETADYHENRQKMVEHFCPNDAFWQQAILFKAWQVFTQLMLSVEES